MSEPLDDDLCDALKEIAINERSFTLPTREYETYEEFSARCDSTAKFNGFYLGKNVHRRRGASKDDPPYQGHFYCRGRRGSCPFQIKFLKEVGAVNYKVTDVIEERSHPLDEEIAGNNVRYVRHSPIESQSRNVSHPDYWQ